MSAETASSINSVEIHVRLLNEGTEVYRPTTGVLVGDHIFQISATADYDPAIEEWEFPPGTRVRCNSEMRGSRKLLVARSRVT